MKKLLWISWHQTPYNEFLFNEISKEFSLNVIYIQKVLSTHPWKRDVTSGYKSYYLEKGKDVVAILRNTLKTRYDLRIVAGWNHPLMFMALMCYSTFNIPFAIWTDTPQVNPKRSWFRKMIHRFLINRIISRARVIMATGKVGVEKISQIYGDIPTSNFPFATDINFYQPLHDNGTPSATTIVCSVGRLLNAHKGNDVAIEAFRLLKEKNSSLKFEYRIVGDGPDRALLTEQIEKAGLKNEVKIIGWLEPDQIRGVFHESSFFIHPSHTDPFPNAVLEAMACGLPVLGSDAAGSVVERVSQDVNGYIFKDGDAKQLSEYLEILMLNPEKFKEFGQQARKTAEQWPAQHNLNELHRILSLAK